METLESTELSPKDLMEIKSSDCKRRYSNPRNFLFLLPGVLFFLFALITRNYGKIFPFFGLLLLLGSSEPDPSAAIRRAEQSFVSGRYLEAMEGYKQAEQQLPCNSAILYNLGILSHYLGRQGYAVHYLRRSLRLAPADGQVQYALQLLEQDYDLAGQVPPPFPVHPDVAFVLLLVFTNVTFIIGAFVLRTKKVQFLITLVLVAIATLGCLAFFVGRRLADVRSVAVVIAEESQLYRVPEEDSKSWFELPAGTSLWIRGSSGQYYLVETPAQIEGWVRSDTILID
ncbi:MAG: hypothetical protein JSV89_15940 [Spirochaetaceae bacterium]|nr:MAG: hypothetical protein JSV89_15940 [Spirochaetaceae bacterium]